MGSRCGFRIKMVIDYLIEAGVTCVVSRLAARGALRR